MYARNFVFSRERSCGVQPCSVDSCRWVQFRGCATFFMPRCPKLCVRTPMGLLFRITFELP